MPGLRTEQKALRKADAEWVFCPLLIYLKTGHQFPCEDAPIFQNQEQRESILIIRDEDDTKQQQHKQILLNNLCLPMLSSIYLLLFSHSVVPDSLQPHEQQHASLLCPSPSPGVCSNSCPLSQWCHPPSSPSVVPFFSCPQSFPASGSFPISRLFTSGGQSIRASASASVLPMNIQNWFPLGLTSWISLQSKGLSRVFSNTTVQKHQFFSAQPSVQSSSHIRTWLPGNTFHIFIFPQFAAPKKSRNPFICLLTSLQTYHPLSE